MTQSSRIAGFYQLTIEERQRLIRAARDITGDINPGLPLETANGMIENVLGVYGLPYGVALNFLVDERDYIVPMVIEEPSVVAAASHAAKLVREGGGFFTETSQSVMTAQIQLLDVGDTERAVETIEAERDAILAAASEYCPGLIERGGGPVDVQTRMLLASSPAAPGIVVVHILVDCCDAMGANLVNTIAEGVADVLASLAQARAGLRILSNLSDERMVRVDARVPGSAFVSTDDNTADDGQSTIDAIVEASQFAELDPYRATTHNKGIMNGIDAVLLATGNDWRGVEAGAHAYAAREGHYAPLAIWRRDGSDLIGTLELPLAVGTVGGALQVHAGAQLSHKILGVKHAHELASVVASAGLASNLAALRALATDGIQRGHMSLHARVVARAAGAQGDMVQTVADQLSASGDFKLANARAIIEQLRAS